MRKCNGISIFDFKYKDFNMMRWWCEMSILPCHWAHCVRLIVLIVVLHHFRYPTFSPPTIQLMESIVHVNSQHESKICTMWLASVRQSAIEKFVFFFKWEKKRKKNVKNNASHKVKIRAALLLSCIFFVVLVNWFHFTLSNGRSVYFRNGIKCKINKLSKCSLE